MKLTVPVDPFKDSIPCEYDIASSKMKGMARPTRGGGVFAAVGAALACKGLIKIAYF